MPAPWTPIPAKDTTVNAYFQAITAYIPTWEQVFAQNKGQSGFSWPESADDEDYIRMNWARYIQPNISSISPTTAAHNTIVALTVNSTANQFQNGAKILWAGVAQTTTFVNAGQLTTSISAASISSAGSYQVQVLNPNGTLSNIATFTAT